MQASHAFEGDAPPPFLSVTGRKRGGLRNLARVGREKTFIFNRFKKSPNAPREQNNRSGTGRQFAVIREVTGGQSGRKQRIRAPRKSHMQLLSYAEFA